MIRSYNVKLAAGLLALSMGACGGDDDDKEVVADLPLSALNLMGEACTKEGDAYKDCSRSKPSSYWQKEGSKTWNANAQVFTIENDATENNWVVKDSDGVVIENKTIELTQGMPTIIHYQNGAEIAKKHYLVAPVFFASAAWRKVETSDAEYKAETFNAVETLKVPNAKISLYFVPMESGTYDGWCEQGTTLKDYKALKAAGNIPLDWETVGGGHAGTVFGEKMTLKFVVSADHDVSLAAVDSTRNTAYNGHEKGSDSSTDETTVGGVTYTKKYFWGKGKAAGDTPDFDKNAPVVLPWVKAEESSDSAFKFVSYVTDPTLTDHDNNGPGGWTATSAGGTDMTATSGITMNVGYATIFKFESPTGNSEKHYFTAPELYKDSVFRKAMDSQGEFKADYFSAIEVLQGKWASLFMVPMKAGSYDVTCTEGSHADMGMVSKVEVVDTAPE